MTSPFRAILLPLAAMCLVLAAPLCASAADLFTVTDIHVDASAASSSEAMNQAIAGGRVRAFQILFRKLTRQQDWSKQPALDAPSLLRLSRGFNIAHERRSTTRYVADVTYVFNPDAVARALRSASIAFTANQAKRILVIPMSPGVSHGPWAQALAGPGAHDGSVPFVVLDAEDDATLGGLNFDAAGWSDVSAVAVKNHVAEVALVQAVYGNGHITVNIRRLGAGGASGKSNLDVPLMQTVGTTYPAAAQAAANAIDDLWKNKAALDYNQRGRLTVDVRITSLAQWGDIQSRVAAVSNVTGVNVVAMDMGYARIVISYIGGVDQLREALGGAGLALASRSGQWQLAAQ